VFLKLKRVLGLKKMNKSGKSGVKEKGFWRRIPDLLIYQGTFRTCF
jgi:hypothetical protein